MEKCPIEHYLALDLNQFADRYKDCDISEFNASVTTYKGYFVFEKYKGNMRTHTRMWLPKIKQISKFTNAEKCSPVIVKKDNMLNICCRTTGSVIIKIQFEIIEGRSNYKLNILNESFNYLKWKNVIDKIKEQSDNINKKLQENYQNYKDNPNIKKIQLQNYASQFYYTYDILEYKYHHSTFTMLLEKCKYYFDIWWNVSALPLLTIDNLEILIKYYPEYFDKWIEVYKMVPSYGKTFVMTIMSKYYPDRFDDWFDLDEVFASGESVSFSIFRALCRNCLDKYDKFEPLLDVIYSCQDTKSFIEDLKEIASKLPDKKRVKLLVKVFKGPLKNMAQIIDLLDENIIRQVKTHLMLGG